MPLIYFLLGIIFIRCVLPLLDQLVSWLLTAIEHRKTKLALRTTKIEKKIEEVVNTDKPTTHQIGFVTEETYSNSDEEEDEYYDDNE
jgi:hypothetical protein